MSLNPAPGRFLPVIKSGNGDVTGQYYPLTQAGRGMCSRVFRPLPLGRSRGYAILPGIMICHRDCGARSIGKAPSAFEIGFELMRMLSDRRIPKPVVVRSTS